MAEKSSITRVGTYEPFNLQVSRGQIAYHRAVTVFGYNPDLDTAEETVWPGEGLIQHPGTASVIKLSSSSADDASAGIGARTVLVEGLDANYRDLSEIVTLSGQTAVNTTGLFVRINRLVVMTAGSGKANAGTIYAGTGVVTSGVPATVYNLIGVGLSASTTAHFTIPAGFTGYLSQGLITAGQPGGSAEIIGKLWAGGFDGIRRVAGIAAINNGAVSYNFEYPIPIPEKTDLEATAIGKSNNNAVSTMFNLVLIQNADN